MAATALLNPLLPRPEAPLALISKGLPPPPKASGLGLPLRSASDVKTVATPLSAAVVTWKDGFGGGAVVGLEGEEGSGVWLGGVKGEVVDVEVEVEIDVDVDVTVEVSSSPVGEGDGPIPGTLFGHR